MLFLVILLGTICYANRFDIDGSGSSTPAPVFDVYDQIYPAYASLSRGVYIELEYNISSSAKGQQDLILHAVDYAGNDVPILDTNQGLRNIPTLIGAIAIIYTLPQLPDPDGPYLNLTEEALVGLFNGTMAWNDDEVLRYNPFLKEIGVPAQKPALIVPDNAGVGSTLVMTTMLSNISSAWNSTYGVFADNEWPSETFAESSDESIVLRVIRTPYSIGYVASPTAQKFGQEYATIRNPAGQWVRPTIETISRGALDFGSTAQATALNNYYVSVVNGPSPNAYPLLGVTYILMQIGWPSDCSEAYELMRYVVWILADAQAASVAASKGYVSIRSGGGIFNVSRSILSEFTCSNGIRLFEKVMADIAVEQTDSRGKIFAISIGVMCGIVLLLIAAFLTWWFLDQKRTNERLAHGNLVKVDVPDNVKSGVMTPMDEFNRYTQTRKRTKKTLDQTDETHDSVIADVPLPLSNTSAEPTEDRIATMSSTNSAPTSLESSQPYQAAIIGDGSVQGTLRTRNGTVTTADSQSLYGTMQKTGSVIAAPITTRPVWQQKLGWHVAWISFRTLFDFGTVAMTFVAYFGLPPGLTLSISYAVLAVIGALAAVMNAVGGILGIIYHKAKAVELEERHVRRRRRVSIAYLAYVQSEVYRLQVICTRESLYRIMLLIREIPIILVSILILAQDISLTWPLMLSLVFSSVALGFKTRSIPFTINDFLAYKDMRFVLQALRNRESEETPNAANCIPPIPEPDDYDNSSKLTKSPTNLSLQVTEEMSHLELVNLNTTLASSMFDTSNYYPMEQADGSLMPPSVGEVPFPSYRSTTTDASLDGRALSSRSMSSKTNANRRPSFLQKMEKPFEAWMDRDYALGYDLPSD
jgi:phosphate transport system substrate-binding protein